MNLFDLEKVNFGLLLDDRKSIMEYSPDDFVTRDFAKAIKVWKDGGQKEDIVKILGPQILHECHDGVARWNGLGDSIDWRKDLVSAKRMYELARRMHKDANALENNEVVDLLPTHGELTSLIAGRATGLTPASEIDFSHYKPFMPLGYKPIDDIIGGVPSDGPIVVFGPQGTGKSFFGANGMNGFLHANKKKNGGVYSLEMSAEHWLYRSVGMYPTLEDVLDRLYVSGTVRNVEELVSEVTTRRLDFIVIDDMDRIVKSVDPAAYQLAYFRLAEICRFLSIPVMILAQPNREGKKSERFLNEYDISWSSAGENSAALLIALQKANALDLDDDIYPMEDTSHYYMIFLKSRDGWPGDYDPTKQRGPGAIRLDGANPKQLWSGKPYMNRLFNPESKKRRIVKKGT